MCQAESVEVCLAEGGGCAAGQVARYLRWRAAGRLLRHKDIEAPPGGGGVRAQLAPVFTLRKVFYGEKA